MASYYRKFCKNFSDIAVPFTELLKKDRKYHWTSNCQHAFDNIKSLLFSVPVLVAPVLAIKISKMFLRRKVW